MIRTATISAVLAVVLALGLLAGFYSFGEQKFSQWLPSWLQNFSSEMFGALATFLLFNLLLGEMERRHEANRTKTQLTIGLHTEFQTSDMLRCRIAAENILVENAKSAAPLGSSALYEKIHKQEKRSEDWLAVSRVLHFYENLGKLHAAKALDDALVQRLFKGYVQAAFANQYFAELMNASSDSEWAEPILTLARALGIDTSKRWPQPATQSPSAA